MRRTAAVSLIVFGLLAAPASAWAKWTRLVSDHFVFIGDAAERDIRGIASRLEEFREVVRVVNGDSLTSPVPTVVIVFRDDRSFTPFKPAFQGRPMAVGGYFIPMEDVNYIAVNAQQEAQAYSVILHEYAHSLLESAAADAPAWVSEGLAEVYQTFESGSDGRTARIGLPSQQNLILLQAAAASLIPVATLAAVDHSSPMYNEGDRRHLFYAESWALVHYLTFGAPARRGQLKTFLDRISDGVAAPDAFVQAFGPDTEALDVELRRYIRASAFPPLVITFKERIAGAGLLPGVDVADADAAGYLGDMMARLNRRDDAREYLERTIAVSPESARALSALGLLELRDGKTDVALPLLEKAALLAPADAPILAAYGRAMTRRADFGGGDADALYAKARTVLARAMELDPGNLANLVTLAEVEMGVGDDLPKAVALMRRAVQAAPGREEYRLLFAQAVAMSGDFRAAKTELGRLAEHARESRVRDGARDALKRVGDAETAARALVAAAAADARGGRGDQLSAPNDPRRESLAQGAFVPALRPVAAGETRVTGVFASVECRPAAIVLVIDGPGGPVRMAARSFTQLDFLSYRQDSPATVACGRQSPAFRVLATFRTDAPVPGADTPNRAVAIELLPDGFSPR